VKLQKLKLLACFGYAGTLEQSMGTLVNHWAGFVEFVFLMALKYMQGMPICQGETP